MNDKMTTDGLPELSAAEAEALEAVRDADARKPETWVNDRIADEQIWASLDAKNLVFWDKPDCIITITDLGKAALAAATATSEKPTTISAREFVEQGYEEKVKRGECGVMDGNKVIVADLPEQILDHLWFQVSLGNSRFNKGYDRNSLFSVTWLPATPPPEQATKPQLSPDEARLLIIRDAFDLSQPIAFAASQLNTMYKEIIELRAERDSMVDELRQLRIQVKKLKRKSNLDDGFIEHLTAKDES